MWFRDVYFAGWVHEPLIAGVTINWKDVLISALLFGPMLIALGCALGRKTGAPRWLAYSAMMPFLLIAYEPGVLVFPYDIVMSARFARDPPVWAAADVLPHLDHFIAPANFSRLQAEIRGLRQAQVPLLGESWSNMDDIATADWRLLPVRTLGRTHAGAAARMPVLAAMLESRPDIVTACVSRLAGNSHIPAHSGVFKGVVRVHIGVDVPEPDAATLTVDGRPLHWREGEAISFDDLFVHSVAHNGTQSRSVLWLDVLRPGLRGDDWAGVAARKMLGWLNASSWIREVERRSERLVPLVRPQSAR